MEIILKVPQEYLHLKAIRKLFEAVERNGHR